jgi:hypothetical protein
MLQQTLRDLRDKVDVMHFDALAKKYRMSRAFIELLESHNPMTSRAIGPHKVSFAGGASCGVTSTAAYPIAPTVLISGPNRTGSF